MNYDKIATQSDLDLLNKDELMVLMVNLKESDVYMDPDTFRPYKVVENVRYDLIPVTD